MSDAIFRNQLESAFESFIRDAAQCYPESQVLRIDLHCHDWNSDVPDELIGRILRCRETWLMPDLLLQRLKNVGMDAVTITNHNNARSCYELQDRGHDVLVGGEFTVTVPRVDVSVHVLAYGFTPRQEAHLNQLRRNIMEFVGYCATNRIPTILAHPLFFYDPRNRYRIETLEMLSVLFENFEVVNGQRDCWQSLLVRQWVDGLTEERLRELEKKHGLCCVDFSKRPYRKVGTGGSDCHMGMFAGGTGTLVHVANLQRRIKNEPASSLALEGIREGAMVPFGRFNGSEKLMASLLSFFCQMVTHLEDPGLLRIMLHKGSNGEKITAFMIANAIMELRRHRYTRRFLSTFQDAFMGKKPGFLIRRTTGRTYRPLLVELERIAVARNRGPDALQRQLSLSLPGMFRSLLDVLAHRVQGKIRRQSTGRRRQSMAFADVARMEFPSHFRKWFDDVVVSKENAPSLNVAQWSDGLPFPALAGGCLLAAHFSSTKIQFANRRFLEEVSAHLDVHRPNKGMLWLSDTFFDRNGVANSLQLMHQAALEYQLPLSFAISHDDAVSQPGLEVLPSALVVDVPFYKEQPIRFVDMLALDAHFRNGNFDRIMVSTEGPMGACALYLKHAYNIPAYFYLHTDWLEYVRRSLGFTEDRVDRFRRMLRSFYGAFDGIFVLNSQQRDWLTGTDMNMSSHKVHLTAHWCNPQFFPRPVDRSGPLSGIGPKDKVILYAGRISDEKGVMELPKIYARVRSCCPETRLVIAGTGPSMERLQQDLPDAIFTGWLDKDGLSRLMSACDVLVFPSRFDTFGNSVLEALSSGIPAIAYDTKGPKDIIEHGRSGFLVDDIDGVVSHLVRLFQEVGVLEKMKLYAVKRAGEYGRKPILEKMMRDVQLPCCLQKRGPQMSRDNASAHLKTG